jgi:microsomal dipeptidase-like Zn-dependent dipeptidase
MKPVIDFHAHISLQPYYMQRPENGTYVPLGDFWNPREKKGTHAAEALVRLLSPSTPMFSETHLNAALQGNVRCIVNPLYPIERGFLKPGEKNTHEKNLWDNVLVYLSGCDIPSINRIQAKERSYFQELCGEYDLLISKAFPQQGPDGHSYYKLVKNYAEILANPGISVIAALEGAQSLSIDLYDPQGQYIDPIIAEEQNLPAFEEYKAQIRANIHAVKNQEFPLLYISPSHHYYNHWAGLSESIPVKILVQKQEISIHGVCVYDMGIQPFGREAIEMMLSRKGQGGDGRRILIDVKHFSPNARRAYFDMVRGRGIPVIASHTAVNGRPSLSDYQKEKTTHPFNPANINLFDDEIAEICNSDGIIGIMLDEKRLYDGITQASLTAMMETDPEEYRKMCCDVLIHQMVHIAHVTNGKGFSHICLGSDFDGGINPLGPYFGFKDLPALRDDLVKRINSGLHHIKNRYREEKNLLKSNPEKYIDDLMFGNADRFLSQYFTDEYLFG